MENSCTDCKSGLGSVSQFWSKTYGSICENLWSSTFFKTTYCPTVNYPEINIPRKKKKKHEEDTESFHHHCSLCLPTLACRQRQNLVWRMLVVFATWKYCLCSRDCHEAEFARIGRIWGQLSSALSVVNPPGDSQKLPRWSVTCIAETS